MNSNKGKFYIIFNLSPVCGGSKYFCFLLIFMICNKDYCYFFKTYKNPFVSTRVKENF